MEAHNQEISMDVSIPGIDQPAQQPGIQQTAQQPAQQPSPGVNDWALQEACKRELSNGVYPKFYVKATENKAMSREKGRPMFEDKEWVYITLRGDRNSVHDYPITDADRNRWPALYQAFKNGQVLAQFGTPLEHWPIMTRADVENFKHYNVFTVEDLAELDDQGIQTIGMGARDLVAKAKAFIEAAEDAAAPSKMVDQIKQMQAQIESLQKNNQELGVAAEHGQHNSDELDKLRIELNEAEVKASGLETRNVSLENDIASVRMELGTVKTELTSTKGQLTKARNELDALKAESA